METDIAWFAGLFEGEGSLSRCRPNSNSSWRMAIRMSDKDIIKRIKMLFGGQIYKNKKPKKKTYRQMWTWQLGKQVEINEIVKMIYPFMGNRRKLTMDEFSAHFSKPTSTSKSENAKRLWRDSEYRNKMLLSRKLGRERRLAATV